MLDRPAGHINVCGLEARGASPKLQLPALPLAGPPLIQAIGFRRPGQALICKSGVGKLTQVFNLIAALLLISSPLVFSPT